MNKSQKSENNSIKKGKKRVSKDKSSKKTDLKNAKEKQIKKTHDKVKRVDKEVNVRKKRDSIKYEQIKNEDDKNSKKKAMKVFRLTLLDVVLIIVMTVVVTSLTTGLVLNYQYKKNNRIYIESLEKGDRVAEFLKVYSDIVENYYEEIDKNALIDSGIEGMLQFLKDKYSIYLDLDESNELTDSLKGTYEGIGIATFGTEIVEVYEASSAYNAGLKVGDIIYKVDDVIIDSSNVTELSTIISSKKDKEITLVIKRGEKEITAKVSFGEVVLPIASSRYFNYEGRSIGYINLLSFSSTSYEQFKKELESLEKGGIESLIIDLRDNGGGYLTSASDIANLFLKKGEVIYSLEKKKEIIEYEDDTDEMRKYSIIVLINENTASAAEILASALKDSYGATLVGVTSFGKGTVQNTKNLNSGSILKYTSAKWLRPNGECVDGVGILPDYEIELSTQTDNQLEKAIQLLY